MKRVRVSMDFTNKVKSYFYHNLSMRMHGKAYYDTVCLYRVEPWIKWIIHREITGE